MPHVRAGCGQLYRLLGRVSGGDNKWDSMVRSLRVLQKSGTKRRGINYEGQCTINRVLSDYIIFRQLGHRIGQGLRAVREERCLRLFLVHGVR